MYKVNMTVADSFNGSGCGPNNEHDEEHNEEHDEGDDSHLNFNSISTGSLIDVVMLNKRKYAPLQKLYDEYETMMSENNSDFDAHRLHSEWAKKVTDYCKTKNIDLSTKNHTTLINKITVLSTENPGLKTYVINYANIDNKKDKFKWNKEVLRYCKNNRIDLGPKPVRTKKETNKVNAKAHHLKNFSVEEHDEDGRHVLEISVKKHDHNKPTPVAKLHDHHKPTTVASVDHYPRDSMGRIITQDGLARVAKGDHYPRDSMGRIIVQDGLSRR